MGFVFMISNINSVRKRKLLQMFRALRVAFGRPLF